MAAFSHRHAWTTLDVLIQPHTAPPCIKSEADHLVFCCSRQCPRGHHVPGALPPLCATPACERLPCARRLPCSAFLQVAAPSCVCSRERDLDAMQPKATEIAVGEAGTMVSPTQPAAPAAAAVADHCKRAKHTTHGQHYSADISCSWQAQQTLHAEAQNAENYIVHLQDLYVLLNGKLLHQALKPLDVQIIPQGYV